jgi:hypothetical protein
MKSLAAWRVILLAGAVAGILDGLDAILYFGYMFHVSPGLIFQSIASGLLGPASFQGGAATVLLGVLLHFTIACGAAAVFYGIARCWPVLLRHPWLSGPVFGLGVFGVMYGVVKPLSRVARRAHPMPLPEIVDELLAHMFLVGLPISLLTWRYSLRPNSVRLKSSSDHSVM